MDLTFQVPMQYCSVQHWTLLPSPVTSTTGCCSCFGYVFILSEVTSPLISSSKSGTYRPGESIFQYPIFLPFHTVCGVLKASILKWFAIPFSSVWKWKWSCSVVSNSSRPHGLQPTRLLRPWDFPGKSTGAGCHCLLRSHMREMIFDLCIISPLLQNRWSPNIAV